MKKWFAFSAIFLSSYLAFLVANAPLSLVVNNIQLPKHINLDDVSGSIWQGEISRLWVSNYQIEKVKISVSFWSLFSLSPSVQVFFGDAMSSGPEGKLNLSVSAEQVVLSDMELLISANDIAKQLALPLPIRAQGSVELSLSELVIVTGEQLVMLKS